MKFSTFDPKLFNSSSPRALSRFRNTEMPLRQAKSLSKKSCSKVGCRAGSTTKSVLPWKGLLRYLAEPGM